MHILCLTLSLLKYLFNLTVLNLDDGDNYICYQGKENERIKEGVALVSLDHPELLSGQFNFPSLCCSDY